MCTRPLTAFSNPEGGRPIFGYEGVRLGLPSFNFLVAVVLNVPVIIILNGLLVALVNCPVGIILSSLR